ncbi:helix-turn-helix domain-containing protein [Cohnella fermenti]|uniref:Helix-turn-helix transcriptional regulator n=1 Tax=Cohnella fermenti TaxID=2565925 RepID=A0A4S4BKS2_9BACL|nr:AraC family transcriptional regulator [Cohnella fermenti]THF75338.1 helix-turn-helix transcriptional regulator [Cohnella fermenti]
MLEQRYPMPELSFYAYFERRDRFIYEVETYREWTVFAVERGSFHYELDGSSGTAAFGDLLFCKPGVPLRRSVIAPLTLQFLRLRWTVAPSADTDAGTGASPIPEGKISIRNVERLQYNYKQLQRTCRMAPDTAEELRNHYIRDIWLTYLLESLPEPELLGPRRPPADSPMGQAMALIERRAFDRCSLQAIASELRLSSYRLSREFKSEVGVSPNHYLRQLRLEKAGMLLVETDLTLAQIAESCGYESGFYLNKLFRKHLGTTPALYRRSNRL